jgi:hypothetical protein
VDAVPLSRLRTMFPGWQITRDSMETYSGFTAVHRASGGRITASTLAELAEQLTAVERGFVTDTVAQDLIELRAEHPAWRLGSPG